LKYDPRKKDTTSIVEPEQEKRTAVSNDPEKKYKYYADNFSGF
jgi:hypothetical protein